MNILLHPSKYYHSQNVLYASIFQEFINQNYINDSSFSSLSNEIKAMSLTRTFMTQKILGSAQISQGLFKHFHSLSNNSRLRSRFLTKDKFAVTLTPCQMLSSSNNGEIKKNLKDDKPVTIEKQLLDFMEMWKMDKAVKLLMTTLKEGFTPNSGVILNLLQQLAHLGEVIIIILLIKYIFFKLTII